MSSKSLPTLFDISVESLEARAYLSDELLKNSRIHPLLTLYKDKTKILSIILPLVDTFEERKLTLYQLSWLTASVNATGVRFVIDTILSFPQADGPEIDKNMLMVFYANSIGCMMDLCSYDRNSDGQIIWEETDLNPKEFIKTQQPLVDLLASQMFFSPHPIPFEQHLAYLKSKGHEVMFHEPYTFENLSYSHSILF